MGIRIPTRTMQIQDGAGRLSPDLAEIAEDYFPILDRENKKLILDGTKKEKDGRLQAYRSDKHRAKSRYVSLISQLRNMGLNPDELDGKVYDVKVDGKKLEIQF